MKPVRIVFYFFMLKSLLSITKLPYIDFRAVQI